MKAHGTAAAFAVLLSQVELYRLHVMQAFLALPRASVVDESVERPLWQRILFFMLRKE